MEVMKVDKPRIKSGTIWGGKVDRRSCELTRVDVEGGERRKYH